MRRFGGLVGVAAWLICSIAGAASAQTRALTPVPFNEAEASRVAVALTPQEPRIGAAAAVCFSTTRAGFITLWNVATSGAVSRVFPNAFARNAAADGAAMRVEATKGSCVGASGDSFRFRVDGPPGIEDLYLLWTATPGLQPGAASFADASAFAASLRPLEGADRADWAVAKTSYDIVPAAGPAAAPLPPRQGSGGLGPDAGTHAARRGRVLVLAMGANVGQLVKPNQDATLFARTVVEAFDVAPDDVRLVANATKADIRAGLEWLRGRAGPEDLVFLYFSGHGGQVPDPTGTSDDGKDEVLIPYDFQAKPRPSLRDAVFSQELARWINALPTANVVSVMDTCHSGGLYRSLEGEVLGARSKNYVLPPNTDMTPPDDLAQAQAQATRSAGGRGRLQARGLLMAAARRDQSALEGPQGSFFTMALLRELRAASGGTFADTFDRAAERTRSLTNGRQNPVTVGAAETARRITFTR